MGRKVIDKVFDIVVRMDVTVRVHANSKEEASAWIGERFINGLTIEDTSSEFIPLELMPKLQNVIVKKVKRPRRVKLTPVQVTTGE
jgi:hypothetical protein